MRSAIRQSTDERRSATTGSIIRPGVGSRGALWAAVTLLAAVGTAAVAVFAFSAYGFASTAIAVAAMALLFAAMKTRLAPLYISPVAIVAVSFVSLGLIGATFYSDVQDARAGGGAEVILDASQTDLTRSILILAGLSVLAGGTLVALSQPKIERQADRGLDITLSTPAQVWLLLAALVPLAITTVGSGASLLRRDLYIESAIQDGALLGLASQLAVACVLGLGYLVASAVAPVRVLALAGTVAYFFVFFAAGSRRLAMLPLLFALGIVVARRTRLTVVLLLASIPASLYLIRVALYLRALPAHGIIPYLEAMPAIDSYDVTWDSIAKNVLISFGIIGATAFQQDPIDPGVFWISINPLPGSSSGWYDEAANLRINVYTPFAGLGELANYGPVYLVAYCLSVGVLLGIFDRQVQRFMSQGLDVLGLVLVGLTGLFVLYSIQYNLRTSTRMLVYGSVAAFLLSWLGPKVARRMSDSRKNRANDSRAATSPRHHVVQQR